MMDNQFLPSYTIGTDAYEAVPEVCGYFGKKAVVIGGKKSQNLSLPKPAGENWNLQVLSYTAMTPPMKMRKL